MRQLLALIDSPLTVTVADTELTIPSLMCDLWLPAIAGTQLRYRIMHDLLDVPSQDTLRELLINGKINIEELDGITNELIAEGSGRDWWVAMRLVDAADAYWPLIGGKMTLGGALPHKVTFSAWLDAAWYLIQITVLKSENGKRSLDEITSEIMTPPREALETSDGEEVEMDEEAFFAAASGVTGAVAG